MSGEDLTRARTIHGVLARQAQRYGDRTFFWFRERSFSYRDFDRESDRVAAGLQALGIGKGDKVGLMMGNRPEYLFVWFGLSKLGAVEVPLNTAHRGDLLTYMLELADCRLVVCEAEFLDRLGPVLGNVPKLERLVVLGDVPAGLAKPALVYEACMANDGVYAAVDVRWSDPFAILFTSGTTGPSKGSLMPQNYALFMGEVVSRSMAYTEDDRLYNVLPLFHGNAQLLSTMAALVSGAQMVLGERFSASEFWPDVKKYGCTEFNYIGGILPILLKAEPRPDDAANPLRVMMGAGAAKDIFLAFEARFGVKLVEGYGMSEIGLPLMNRVDGERVPGSIGRPAFGCEVRLVDDEGIEITEPGVPGEVLVRTDQPYTMLIEYYKMPEKTVEAWRDLWFHTGDYATRDAAGGYYFVDRKKDALRRRGENISSYEVECVINTHPAVLESAAVAIKSELGEDEVMVCLTLKPEATLAPEALMDHCQSRMAYFMVPRYVRILKSLPKTPTEKIQKAELRKEGLAPDTWDREQAGYELKR
ncbi:MAG: AMP-binding protein [Gammaproteobacteria bacterium]|nr:AMP-binding protein [Gammaproteobacteria bacterium]